MSKSRRLPWVLLPGHLRGARSCRGPVSPRGCWGRAAGQWAPSDCSALSVS